MDLNRLFLIVDRLLVVFGTLLAVMGAATNDVFATSLGAVVALNAWGSNARYIKLHESVISELGWKAQSYVWACRIFGAVLLSCAIYGYSLFGEEPIGVVHRILAALIALAGMVDARRIPGALGGVRRKSTPW